MMRSHGESRSGRRLEDAIAAAAEKSIQIASNWLNISGSEIHN
ncbi:hypothetical protein [Halomicronema hongdechloris]|nr:hypothetical protein [Halomicronema hongdechloris]